MNSLEHSIYDFIGNHKACSCVELYCEFGKGDYWLTCGNNVIVGFGLSDEASEALHNLIETADIVHLPCSYLVYLLDGGAMTLPIAEKIPKKGYKTPHWQPSCFYTYPDAIKYIKEKCKDKPKYRDMLIKLIDDRRQRNK